ncbi:hypothetical protein GGQ80_001892 [Sphingomonas jinjuensis]|uniref:Uncharacterized protein n=1 Tax=Sphingomonas jinjuensis TaxID=535907 RepID=A0A840FCK7_9SPHN|nr:hypothetical protein [Sphingomonas jinjuensis]MBB4153986.1 hypothetical protein [Sphingomonas jinjuensis]
MARLDEDLAFIISAPLSADPTCLPPSKLHAARLNRGSATIGLAFALLAIASAAALYEHLDMEDRELSSNSRPAPPSVRTASQLPLREAGTIETGHGRMEAERLHPVTAQIDLQSRTADARDASPAREIRGHNQVSPFADDSAGYAYFNPAHEHEAAQAGAAGPHTVAAPTSAAVAKTLSAELATGDDMPAPQPTDPAGAPLQASAQDHNRSAAKRRAAMDSILNLRRQ